MTVGLQVEKIAEKIAVVVFISGALIDGQHAGLAVFGLPARLHALGVDLVILVHVDLLLGGNKLSNFIISHFFGFFKIFNAIFAFFAKNVAER